ncbi:MAG: FAD-dependent oxidoreductase [Planctomycetales bacterium]|nr:FAD-dependent oxidoreductase [Planctomycetales bacterium]
MHFVLCVLNLPRNMKQPDQHRILGRRELLAYLAGVPVAGLVGCNFGRQNTIQGELLSPDLSIGHRLRDGWRPPQPTQPPQQRRVVIVGGGMAGLSAAWQLGQRGVDDFVVLELESQPGGTSRSGQKDGFKYPWGAHYVPAPMKENAPLVELFRQMGVVIGQAEDGQPIIAEQYLCRDPEERVFVDGQWISGLYPSIGADEQDLDQLTRFRETMQSLAARRDLSGRRFFAIPMSTGSDDDEVRLFDRISMAQWMDENEFSSPRLRWLVDHACRDDYGLTIRQTSAWAGLFYFASRLKGDGSESQPVITWPEGNGRIIQFLADRCGDRMRCGHVVTEIQRNDDDQTLVRVFDSKSSASVDYLAGDVIFAAPQFLAPHVIAGWKNGPRSNETFRYGGWVVANVMLSGRPAEEYGGMCWDNVIYDSRSLGYVTSTHQSGLDHGPTVVSWYHPLLDDDPKVSRAELLRLGWSDWARVVISDLQKAHPEIATLIERIDVMRWGHAMIQPRVGFVWGGERQQASESIGRIHFAGTDLSGIALMEEAFDRGVQAGDRCVG